MYLKRIISSALFLFLTIILFSQEFNSKLPTFQPNDIRDELQEVFKELRENHPGFYRYNDSKIFDRQIAEILYSINTPLTEFEIYRLVKPLFAQIGCLHTGISLSDKTESTLNSFSNCIPLGLFRKNDKIIIWKNYSRETAIPIGAEIISINGKSIESIYATLLQNIPMDGYNTTGKYKLLEYSFPTWYRNVIELTTNFEIEIKIKNQIQTYSLKGIKADLLPSYKKEITSRLNWNIQNKIATLTIPSFAKSYHKKNGIKFKDEIKRFFQAVEKQNIKNIVIDLRGNTGGSDSYAAYLTSYFFDVPFRYWDRIEVCEDIANDLKGIKRIFYGKPKKKNDVWLWSTRGLASKEFKFTKTQKAAKHNFKGNVYVIIDGLCMSSCADIAAILQSSKKAIFVGEETGGGYQGNTSGLIPEEPLSSGLIMSVPLLKYFNAVDSSINIGKGTVPDFPISSDPLLKLADKDLEMEKIFKLINNQ